jgi:hypothetical protein
MKILYKNYILQPGLNAKDRWDLIKTITVTVRSDTLMGKKRTDGRKEGDSYEKKEELGYDMMLENAISKCISYLLAENESVTNLRGYLDEYKRHKSELIKLLKQ